jgi:hypothetical protein
MKRLGVAVALILGMIDATAFARGVSPYLPLNLDPELERQITRILLLADKPALTRPIAAATVLEALSTACRADPVTCLEVRRALSRYMHVAGVTHASIEGAATDDDSLSSSPNLHGMRRDSAWRVSASAYWQPSDFALLSAGAILDEDESVPTGSMLSLGMDRAQLDVGYRGHWLSPMSDSSMLLGSNAATMPSITLSNHVPMTRWGFHYEAFVARMSHSVNIATDDGSTSGHPKLGGLHLSIEPAHGWALGVTRLMQYGGGERGGRSFSDLFNAFFRPSRYDNVNPNLSSTEQFGNQLAAITSEFVFPGRTPFSVYFEYAGEDTSRGRDYLLGNAALSAGIRFPRLWGRFDLTLESSEWQNGWYVNSIYGDGLRNQGNVLGHWGADQRVPGDAVGARSHMLRIGWSPPFGGHGEMRLRTLTNESYSNAGYSDAHELNARYSRPFGHLRIGADVTVGSDVFGADYTSFGAFARYIEDMQPAGSSLAGFGAQQESGTEVFMEAGIVAGRVKADLADDLPRVSSGTETGAHFALGARRAVSDFSDLGARIEVDEIDGSMLLAARAIDYRYRFSRRYAFTFFVGAARYDLATPAYGLYYGVGGQWRNVMPNWDVGFDLRYATKVARDHLLPEDPGGVREDSFYDISGATLALIRRF